MLEITDRGTATASGAATALSWVSGAPSIPTPNCLIAVAITIASATATTTMSLAGMTWTLVGRQAGSSVTSELWVGYGASVNTAPVFVNTPSVSVTRTFVVGVFETGTPQTSARTTTSVGATGTSTITDPGATRAAPVGGAWFQASAYNAGISPTARTGGQAYVASAYQQSSLGNALYYRSGALDQNAVQMTETIASNNWAVVSGTTTLDQLAGAVNGNIYKGRDTLLLDQNEEA